MILATVRAARVALQGFFDFASEDGPEATFGDVSVARDWRGYASDRAPPSTSPGAWLGREALLGAHHVLAPRFDEKCLGVFEIRGLAPQQPGRSSDGLDPCSRA